MAYSATLQRTRRQSLGHFLSSRNFMQGIIKKADAVQSLQQQSAMPGPDKKRRRKKSLISGAERTKQWREIANKPAKIRHIAPANREGTIKDNIFELLLVNVSSYGLFQQSIIGAHASGSARNWHSRCRRYDSHFQPTILLFRDDSLSSVIYISCYAKVLTVHYSSY